MKSSLRAACLVVSGALWSCQSLAGVLLGEPRSFNQMKMEVGVRDGVIMITAEHPFAFVACGPVPDDPRKAAYEPPPAVWRARCREYADCVSTVRYGDTLLDAEIPPTPIAAGICYRCNAKGKRGWGSVEFVVRADGQAVEPCPAAAPPSQE